MGWRHLGPVTLTAIPTPPHINDRGTINVMSTKIPIYNMHIFLARLVGGGGVKAVSGVYDSLYNGNSVFRTSSDK